jgi:phosphoribosylcarboxyaminoimidazole (NCAIR) mutase
VSVGRAHNAGLLAARILAIYDQALYGRLEAERAALAAKARAKGHALRDRLD